MKVVILAGGFGTRITEESHLKPKPMIEIGGRPMLWHIMKTYSSFGHNEFIICLGYKGYLIKEYFANYYLHQSNITFDFAKGDHGEMEVHSNAAEPWRVTLIDTGLNTLTGGRLGRVKDYIGKETFMLTYGDGVADIDINKLIAFHHDHGKIATLTSVQPNARFGILDLNQKDVVVAFKEKPKTDTTWINVGFFVFEPKIFDYLGGDEVPLEGRPLENLSSAHLLMAYKHRGFWQCMDTIRDRNILEEYWQSGRAPWNLWAPISEAKAS